MISDYQKSLNAQAQATDPNHSYFVSANAGSGKTRILVNRVARLLLAGAKPETIVCLTYTKTAASEMQNRLFTMLGEWSILPDEALHQALQTVIGKEINTIAPGTARQLFAQALETPDGLKIKTIHAFCEQIIARFPMEAGTMPGFELLDATEQTVLFTRLIHTLFAKLRHAPETTLAQATQRLITNLSKEHFTTLCRWAIENRPLIRQWHANGDTAPLAKKLGLMTSKTSQDILTQAWQDTDKASLQDCIKALTNSQKQTDVNAYQQLQKALAHPDPVQAFGYYSQCFFTKSLQPRKNRLTQNAPKKAHNILNDTELTRIHSTLEQSRAAQCLSLSQAIYTLCLHLVEDYQQLKRQLNRLDFEDLIDMTLRLLTQSGNADWIRYKLDAGIHHILIDEAQDTSPSQWQIIDAIKSAFIETEPTSYTAKTFFAVGDEKQSIFSFQGAQPNVFIHKTRQHLQDHQDKRIHMSMSFRTAPDILKVIDAVFITQKGYQRSFHAEAHAPASDILPHTAFRQDSGRVELWPLARHPKTHTDEIPARFDMNDGSNPNARERLAQAIATRMKTWLDRQEPIYDRKHECTRPMCPGDILILVRQRGPQGGFFDALIRNIKTAGIPVAGADRLVVGESILVKDLLSLARFVLLPSDDLSLAEVLKSPLFNFDETELFNLAYARQGDLWEALQQATTSQATIACTQLTRMIQQAHHLAPYEFFTYVLTRLTPQGHSLRYHFMKRLGSDIEDICEVFLNQALAHQQHGPSSLQHFVHSFEHNTQELKREPDRQHNEVRIMTVHGAKGLEAPLVILPDTSRKPTQKRNIPIPIKEGGLAFAPNKESAPEQLQPDIDTHEKAAMQEYRRLLYVAMTRAESRLIICGFQTGQAQSLYQKESWYAEITDAMRALKTQEIETPFGKGEAYGALPAAISGHEKAPAKSATLPDWTRTPLETDHRVKTHTASSILQPHASEISLIAGKVPEIDAVLRGNILHKLLQILPDLPIHKRRSKAESFVHAHKHLTPQTATDLINEVLNLLNSPKYACFFTVDSRAEVPIAGYSRHLHAKTRFHGQIDRLCLFDDHIYIIDYKSDRHPPNTPEAINPAYIAQMAVYRALVQEIYPHKPVYGALLWTYLPAFMPIPNDQLNHALTHINSLLI